ERYRSADADNRDVLAVGAGDTVDRTQGANAVRHKQRAQAVQPGIAVRRIGRVELTACADPLQRPGVLELLQKREVVVAGNAEQVPDAGLLEAAKQEVADLHSSSGTAGHCAYLHRRGSPRDPGAVQRGAAAAVDRVASRPIASGRRSRAG